VLREITASSLAEAAGIIKNGGLVVFPTETVYGLGADAFNAEAVKRVYAAKGRPPDNPLILHVNFFCEIEPYVTAASETTKKLVGSFWPGPLTLVLNKSEAFPKDACMGIDTVAVRSPSNETARKLIELSGRIIAAPSANKSGKPSPTCAAHAEADLAGEADMILDGGETAIGLESTVLDCTGAKPLILRLGAVTAEQIESVLGVPVSASGGGNGTPKSPGVKYKHYSPEAEMTVVKGAKTDVLKYFTGILNGAVSGRPVGFMAASTVSRRLLAEKKWECLPGIASAWKTVYSDAEFFLFDMGPEKSPETAAKKIFSILRHMDCCGAGKIFCEAFDESGAGAAVMDRLLKAAGGNLTDLTRP